jgi:hypothetical protein
VIITNFPQRYAEMITRVSLDLEHLCGGRARLWSVDCDLA